MEIANLVQEIIRAFGGIKSSLPQGALNSVDAEDCVNFVTRRGRLRKLWGTDLIFNSGFGAGRIQWISRLQNLWVAQHGSVVIREQTEGGFDFQLEGGIELGEANRISSARWENRLFLSNGVDNKFLEYNPIDGFRYRNLGLLPLGGGIKPSAIPYRVLTDLVDITEVAATGTGLTAGLGYIYTVTLWDDKTQTESLPYGAFVGEDGLWQADPLFAGGGLGYLLANASKALRVDISALKALGYDAERTTHFIVYRTTQADIETYKRCFTTIGGVETDKVPIANNFLDDETPEADLGVVLDLSLSPPPGGHYYRSDTAFGDTLPAAYGARFVEFFRDQLWLFGVRYPGTRYGINPGYRSEDTNQYPYSGLGTGSPIEEQRFSPQSGIAYGSDVGNPDYWKYTYDIGKSTGQEDTGMAKFGNILMFFKERSSYYLVGSSPENYEVRDLDPYRGFIFANSVRATTAGVIGIGEAGFTLFEGVGPGKLIADELFDYVNRINRAASDQISSAFDSLEDKYECSVPLDQSTHNTHTFSFDCKTRSWSVTRRVFGAAAYSVDSNKKSVSLLGDKMNGRLYSASDYSKVTLNGETMHGKWRSKAFDFGLPGELKGVQMVEITARAVTDFRLSIDLIVDMGQGDTASVEDHPPTLRGDVWAEDAADDAGMKWDTGQWSTGTERKKFTILIQGVGKNFNLVIRNSDKDAGRASFEIEEVVVHASRLSGDNDS